MSIIYLYENYGFEFFKNYMSTMYCRCYYEFLLSSQTNHIKYYHSQYRNEEIQAGNMKMKKDRVEGISLNLHSRKTAKMGFNLKPLI